MEEQIRKIVREEIARALGAVGEIARGVWEAAEMDSAEEDAAQMLRRTMERVARDVLANVHPAVEDGQDDLLAWARNRTASTPDRDPGDACTCGHDFYRHREGACLACTCPRFHPAPVSTLAVHTITVVPERPKAACTCSRHKHVMGHNDMCGHPGCYCRTPVRAQAEHTSTPPSTEAPRACTVCLHGEHDQGNCGMHVYVDGVARPCPCLASRTVRSTRGPGCGHITCEGWSVCRDPKPVSTVVCTVCEHAPHEAHLCSATIRKTDGWTASCECGGRA